MKVAIISDGAASHIGTCATGWVIVTQEGGALLESGGSYLGEGTVNEAEYQAMIEGAEALLEMINKEVVIEHAVFLSDSELVVNQLNGFYQVKAAHLRPYYDRMQKLWSELEDRIGDEQVKVDAVSRDYTHQAHNQAQAAMAKGRDTRTRTVYPFLRKEGE